MRTTKSLADLVPVTRIPVQSNCTTQHPFSEEPENVEQGLRYRSEEVLSDRDKERSICIEPARRLDHINPQQEINCRHLSMVDHRYPSSNVRAENLQSAEQIANFQSRENSPYSKRKHKCKVIEENDSKYVEIGLYGLPGKTDSTLHHDKSKQLRDDSSRKWIISTQSETLSNPVENTGVLKGNRQANN